MKRNFLVVGTLAAAICSSTAFAADSTMTAQQKMQFEQVIHDYLIKNPEVLVEASQVLQQKQQESMQKEAKNAIQQNNSQLLGDTISVAGNPKGNVTLIEFFDYQCIHCKKMKPIVSNLIQNDKNLRVIYKEFPIFGKSSELASRAALAAAMQGKYSQLQDALLKIDKHLDKDIIMQAAQSAGLNMEKLKSDMDSQKVTEILDSNRQLAEKMHLMGTPAFIVVATPDGQFKAGSEPAFIPGAATEETLRDLIKKAAG